MSTPSAWALIVILLALVVSLTGALDVRGRLKSDRARRRLRVGLVAAAVLVAALQYFLQGRSAQRIAQLEASTRPRSLTAAQQAAMVAALKPFAGQKYWLIVQTNDTAAEQVRFATIIDAALVEAGWVKSQNVMRRDSASSAFVERPLPLYERVSETGVVVFAPADDLRAAGALKEQLESLSFRVELGSDENLRGSIVVQIGPR